MIKDTISMLQNKRVGPLLAMVVLFIACKNNDIHQTQLLRTLVSPHGVSEMSLVFEPGLQIGDETVAKTFQPSYVVTSRGTLLAFCQGRIQNAEDNEPKVILMNTSHDYGKTWQGVRVLSGPMNHFAISAYTSPLESGERVSFLTCVGLRVTKDYYDHDYERLQKETGIDLERVGHDKAAVLCRYFSDDDGVTWQMETLTHAKTPLFKSYDGYIPVFFNTIGQVHKIENGPYKGRYIIGGPVYAVPPDKEVTNDFRNHPSTGSAIIYSEDRGETWQMDGMITDYLGNEASAGSVREGKELFMIRRYMDDRQLDANAPRSRVIPARGERIAHTSEDGGASWSSPFLLDMSSVRCHGTLARVNDRLYFSIPEGIGDREKVTWDADRVNGAIYYSDDDGETWTFKIIEESYFSYSTVGKLADGYMITFYSRGGHGDKGIGYKIFTDEWLESGL
jgi:sialidase-1